MQPSSAFSVGDQQTRDRVFAVAALYAYLQAVGTSNASGMLKATQATFNALRGNIPNLSSRAPLVVDGRWGSNTWIESVYVVFSAFDGLASQETLAPLATRDFATNASGFAQVARPLIAQYMATDNAKRMGLPYVYSRWVEMLRAGNSPQQMAQEVVTLSRSGTTSAAPSSSGGATTPSGGGSTPKPQPAPYTPPAPAPYTPSTPSTPSTPTRTPTSRVQELAPIEIESAGAFSWEKAWPFVFFGVAALGGAVWWYWKRKPGRRGLRGAGTKRHKAPSIFGAGR